MLNQNQTTCTAVIGSANYDIGHVFGTGGGGVAFLSCVCSSTNKAKGVTCRNSPVGDPFDIDYVAHEMGHQFGGAHTQNNPCNSSASSAMEPGSASTIMGYAGICNPNVQANSDDYFHARSLQQIGAFVTGSGNACATTLNTGNNLPTVDGGPNYTIPKSTPYVLTATGSDPNGNILTYCWEQMNPEVGIMPPLSNNAQGPMFRSLLPVSAPYRYFPDFDAVVDNTSPTWEVLSSVARTLAFRVTARDNFAGAGCTEEDDVTITVSGSAGPFLVSAPNGGDNWNANSTQTVTWNVAGTNASPVSCANVSLLLSTDDGYTYPYVLAASTPNNGSAAVTAPNLITDAARVMVQSIGNVFYDISNANFSILEALPVQLIGFHAEVRARNDVWLSWSTASEKDNSGFEVEMRAETAPDFSKIGWVRGQGTSAGIHSYSFLASDLDPGTYYFRLKQTDNDGTTAYSPIQTATIIGGFRVSCFPNPVETELLVQMNGLTSNLISFKLINQYGQLMYYLEEALPGNDADFKIPANEFDPGVYFYWIQNGKEELFGKILIK